jgi:hypothetical protein
MSIKLKMVLFIVIAFVVNGCVDNKYLVKPNFNPAASSHGLIMASVTRDGGTDAWFTITNLNNNKKYYVSSNDIMIILPKSEFSGDNNFGRLQILDVEPGKYAITNWKLLSTVLGGTKEFAPKHLEPVTFYVKRGQITYIGNLHIKELRAENIFGIKIPAGAIAVVRDKFYRDREVLQKKYPNLINMPINKSHKYNMFLGIPKDVATKLNIDNILLK